MITMYRILYIMSVILLIYKTHKNDARLSFKIIWIAYKINKIHILIFRKNI